MLCAAAIVHQDLVVRAAGAPGPGSREWAPLGRGVAVPSVIAVAFPGRSSGSPAAAAGEGPPDTAATVACQVSFWLEKCGQAVTSICTRTEQKGRPKRGASPHGRWRSSCRGGGAPRRRSA